jgi:hypothetical protein
MKKLTLIALALVVFLTAGFALNCNKQFIFGGKQGLPGKNETHSAKGVQIFGWDRVTPEQSSAVDKGLEDLFRIASAPPNNYSGFGTHSEYIAYLLPWSHVGQGKYGCVTPGFLNDVGVQPPAPDGYDETYTDSPDNHWDKDPRPKYTMLCVAGFMARKGATGESIGQPILAVVSDMSILARIIRFEGEHALLLEVDVDRFVATQYHYGTNGGHPIMPDTDGNLMSEPTLVKLGLNAGTIIASEDISLNGEVIIKAGQKVNVLVSR